ncbi:MAG: 2-hydroxyacyl-CoA dehydratase family protein [Candidatus Bathyarchaeota archaeon]|nr:2-hydroxyacyl-CoA dehydratase family protein [Candidatus Bathyarchaeota archaeon]MDH5733768.1 2-hydroxyacyl-CoA dehydratase family protein [Candidatus Bathyarchaeota archaeon]
MQILQSFKNLLHRKHIIAKTWKNQNKRPVVGWNSTYTPEEIISAINALPIRILGSMDTTTTLADAYLPRNACSFARSTFDHALKGDYNYLDGFVTSNSCDNFGKTYDLWRHYTQIPYFHFINTPHTNTPKSSEFLYYELIRFKESLEKHFKTTITNKTLQTAIKTYNENRTFLKQVYNLRRKDPPLLSGVEALEIVLSSMLTTKQAHNKLLKQLLSEVTTRPDPPKPGVRLLITGSIMDTPDLLNITETVGGIAVTDDLCTGTRYFWNLVEANKDPLEAIAKRYINKIPSPFMHDSHRERFNHIKQLIKDYDVEAVIIFLLKFCDTHMFDAPLLTEELKAEGIPVLNIEYEHTRSGIAPIKTRIEAFIEMVKGVP